MFGGDSGRSAPRSAPPSWTTGRIGAGPRSGDICRQRAGSRKTRQRFLLNRACRDLRRRAVAGPRMFPAQGAGDRGPGGCLYPRTRTRGPGSGPGSRWKFPEAGRTEAARGSGPDPRQAGPGPERQAGRPDRGPRQPRSAGRTAALWADSRPVDRAGSHELDVRDCFGGGSVSDRPPPDRRAAAQASLQMPQAVSSSSRSGPEASRRAGSGGHFQTSSTGS